MSFADRLARGRAGDPAALEELFAPWRPLLRLQAGQLLGAELSARVDASDVVQEAWRQAFADLDQFRGGSAGEWLNWLRALVAGQAANMRRFHHAGKRSPDREDAWPVEHVAAAPAPGPAAEAVLHEEDARVAAALEALPADMHAVVVGRVFQREPFEAVARALGRSPGATRVLWTRAVRRLRQMLADPS
jgi:RNA polymerase sigma-70 factor (ECF subfamily)